MKENKIWITIGIVFLVGSMTRIMWDRIGGVRTLPYLMQIVIMMLIPIILLVVTKKERKKINKFQYKLLRLFIIFFTIMAGIISIIILNNSFPMIWIQYRTVFQVITPALFLLFSVYTAVITICNTKNIK